MQRLSDDTYVLGFRQALMLAGAFCRGAAAPSWSIAAYAVFPFAEKHIGEVGLCLLRR